MTILSDVLAVVRRVVAGVCASLRGRQQARQLQGQIPILVDFLAVAVGSGASLLQSIEFARDILTPPMCHELDEVCRRVGFGALLPTALSDQGARNPLLKAVVVPLAQAIRLGSPLQATLQRIAKESRASAARAAAAHSRTVAVRLIFPLVLLVLPALILTSVVPALVAGWRGL